MDANGDLVFSDPFLGPNGTIGGELQITGRAKDTIVLLELDLVPDEPAGIDLKPMGALPS